MSPEGSQSPDHGPEDSLAAKLKARFGEGVDPGVSLHAADETGEKQPDFSSALVTRLSGRSGSFGRYRVKGEIARGGMGAILKIWDEDLHRHLAMKVIPGQVEGGNLSSLSPVPSGFAAAAGSTIEVDPTHNGTTARAWGYLAPQ